MPAGEKVKPKSERKRLMQECLPFLLADLVRIFSLLLSFLSSAILRCARTRTRGFYISRSMSRDRIYACANLKLMLF